MAEKIKKKVTTIYFTENLLAQLKQESIEDSISLNQRILSLLLIGKRAEDSTERDDERTTSEIQRLVKEEFKQQNQTAYVNSDKVVPLNRYEVENL